MAHFAFRDFAPKQKRPAGFFQSAESDNLMEAVLQANLWVVDHKVRVMNIETVVLPNNQENESISSSVPWYQFIRVWYAFEEKAPESEEIK
ncbi:hypothetical protein [Armatimonas sp.]|uniref:hypothetical protein n=1 Tax=Armatimonas sp. TaxID=1872638 RepID=UPI00375008E7